MSRAKTVAFFAWIGPIAAAVPFVLAILTLAAFHRDATGLGIAVAALFLAYLYGLIPSAIAGLLFSWIVRRHPHVVNRAASVARVGAVAGFLSSLPLAAWAFLFTEKVLAHDHALMALAFLVPGIFSGAVCAVLWRRYKKGAHDGKAASHANRSAAILLGFLAMLISSWPMPLSAADAAETSKPSILLIIADDLATRLGCYGDKAAITPNLDRLSAEGVVFSRAYCQGAVCTPSRTSFMLGLNTRHAKANHFIDHPDTMTMGRWFREHGWQTAAIGKIDHDDPNDAYTDPKAWDVRVKREEMAPKVATQNTFFDEDLGQRRKRVSLVRLADSPEAMGDWVRAERMIQFFEQERDPSKPFFAAIGFHTPHVPWDSTKAHFDAHDPAKFTPEITPSGATPLPSGSLLQEPGMEMTEAHQREGIRAYYAAVTTLDQQIGRLLDHLRAKGQLDQTLVVFTSDHGYHLGWRGQWCKHSLSEQVLRVPLIVRHPQGAKGAKAGGIVELLDLFPTLCDFAGIPAPETLDGRSFLPLLMDPEAEGKPGAFCQWGNSRTVRTLRWRLTERRDGSRELYDHSADPAEYDNLIAKPEHAPLVERLSGMLDAEFGKMGKSKAK